MADSLNNFFNQLGGNLSDRLGNPVAGRRPFVESSGNVRVPFLSPTVRLSDVYSLDGGGISRTNESNPVAGQGSKSPLKQLSQTKRDGNTFLQKPGFTPIEYYKVEDGYRIKTPEGIKSSQENYNDFKSSFGNIGDERMSDFRFTLDDYVKFNYSKNDIEASDGSNNDDFRFSQYLGTPYDNEDPVYFGFEVILNVDTSPLLNGELESFLNDPQFSQHDEVVSRRPLIEEFKNELQKYFKLTRDIGDTNVRRRYYVRSLTGLGHLVEKNNSIGKPTSFVNYGTDKITIKFFEDTTLNLGKLASIYKLLYWSRLRGKGIIPENLLRFDCEIIVSELRNFVRVKKNDDILEYLRSNLNRYRYQVYECQLFFDKMTHPDMIDMTTALKQTDSYEVGVFFKYSTMVFETYDPENLWKRYHNNVVDPLGGRIPVPSMLDYNETLTNIEYRLGEYSRETSEVVDSGDLTIENLRRNTERGIYNSINLPIPETVDNFRRSNLYSAATKLAENLKTAVLNEAQRRLNDRFRLVNDTIDRIRNSYGIGRMREPTNVYNITQQNLFFFDVKNSLRDFAGDTLSGLIGGRR